MVIELALNLVDDFNKVELRLLSTAALNKADFKRDQIRAKQANELREQLSNLSLVDVMAIDSAVNRLGGLPLQLRSQWRLLRRVATQRVTCTS